MNTTRNSIARFSRPAAALSLALALGAMTATPAMADQSIVAYGTTNALEQRIAKADLDAQINVAAARANASLTAAVMAELNGRVRSKLRLSSTRMASRG